MISVGVCVCSIPCVCRNLMNYGSDLHQIIVIDFFFSASTYENFSDSMEHVLF